MYPVIPNHFFFFVVCDRRLQLDDPSSAPQLSMFTGSFRLATNGSASSGTGSPSAALEKVKLALDGYAAQGDAKELAQDLLKEENADVFFFK